MPSIPCAKCGNMRERGSGNNCRTCKKAWDATRPALSDRRQGKCSKCHADKALNVRCNPCRSETARRSYADDPSRYRNYGHRRRALKRNAEGAFTKEDWEAIVISQDGKCNHCGVRSTLTVDHVVPLTRGGSNWPSNLQGLCRPCNSRKYNKLEHELSH